MPEIAVGIIISSEVPLATRSLVPKASISTGTTITPPPTPISPARMPVPTPTPTSAMPVSQESSKAASREGITRNRLTITIDEEPDEAPPQRRLRDARQQAGAESAHPPRHPPPG